MMTKMMINDYSIMLNTSFVLLSAVSIQFVWRHTRECASFRESTGAWSTIMLLCSAFSSSREDADHQSLHPSLQRPEEPLQTLLRGVQAAKTNFDYAWQKWLPFLRSYLRIREFKWQFIHWTKIQEKDVKFRARRELGHLEVRDTPTMTLFKYIHVYTRDKEIIQRNYLLKYGWWGVSK